MLFAIALPARAAATGPSAAVLFGKERAPGGTASRVIVPAATHIRHRSPAFATSVALESAFASGRFSKLKAVTPNRFIARELLGRFTYWKNEGLPELHVGVVYTHRLTQSRMEATLSFSGDRRSPSEYMIAVLDTSKRPSRIVGTTTGLQGSYFTRATWSVTRENHFILYHSPYQIAGSDRDVIADLEYQRSMFARKFGVRLPPLAAYYLYPTPALMARLTARACGANPENVGCTNPFASPPTIQTIEWPSYHEPIHIYERALEPKPRGRIHWVAPLFIAEGMAVALEDKTVDPRLSDYCSDLLYVPLDECADVALRHIDPQVLLRDKGFKHADAGYAYALSGSFVKYMILKYGYHAFGRFYYRLAAQPTDGKSDYDVAAKAVYHRSIEQLLWSWDKQLRSGS
ncbi:MAG: hypothetical protein ACREP2_12220 [Rhodanobacteraceae bacterium]